MKTNLILLSGLLFSATLFSQYTIQGILVESSTEQAIDYATVVLHDTNNDEVITGVTTENGGKFELQSPSKEIYLKIDFIGFTSKVINDFNFSKNKIDLGIITLNQDAKVLDEVVVTAEKSTTEFKLDKRVFNVGKDLSSTGASALEVLDNVPSVNVNIEGEISLRGSSGVQILINGKPSVLADESSNALGTITADMMEKVEVITNPSAKYEAEGTAGIINIILKKNEKKGVNGSISINTGIPHNHSIGLSLNNRTEKFNLFTQLGVGYRELPSDTKYLNQDFIIDQELSSIGKEYRNENYYNIILGTDYYINPKNVITLSGSFSYEVEDQPSETDFRLLIDNELEQSWTRTELTSATNPKLQFDLQYKRDFEDSKDHQLQLSAVGNYFGKEQSSVFNNNLTFGSTTIPAQLTATTFDEGKYTFNLDYTKPFGQIWTIETGFQYLTNNVSNDFEVQNKNDLGEYETDVNLTNVFDYNQDVLGVYATTAYEKDLWGLKLGLRVENTNLNTLLVNTNESNSNNFTNLFPSGHASYKLSEKVSFQTGYSKRIFRPRLWDLNPFFNIRNNFNVRRGNPNLLPEYTDSYESGIIFIYEQVSFNVNVFHRYTTDKIDRIISFENGVSSISPENIGTNKATGTEANFKFTPSKKLVINGDALYNYFKREGEFKDQNFDFSAGQWNAKLTTKYKLNKKLDSEISLRHESKEQTIQGEISANTFMNFGLRYKILKNRAVFSFSIRDVFASRIRKTTVQQQDFFTEVSGQRGRFITLGFSYGFGKGEAMQYSGNRRR